jgi:hypothetical protein
VTRPTTSSDRWRRQEVGAADDDNDDYLAGKNNGRHKCAAAKVSDALHPSSILTKEFVLFLLVPDNEILK